jgi:serine phosphatase RsbU (regulator of sigma subunit)
MSTCNSLVPAFAIAAAVNEPQDVASLEQPLDDVLTSHDLQIARHIQSSLIPAAFPLLEGFGLSAYCRCAQMVAGDFYDAIPLTSDSSLLVVADVMGKGVPAALFAASLRTLIRSMVQWTHDPAELLSRVNHIMFPELSSVDVFLTAQIVLINTRTHTLHVASAGHCPLLLTGPNRVQRRSLPAQDMPIGIVPDLAFAHESADLLPGTCALLYTDGIPDAHNCRGECFGQRRLESWFHVAASRVVSAAALKQKLVAEIKHFQGEAPPRDDQTFLLLADERAQARSASPPSCGHLRWGQTP